MASKHEKSISAELNIWDDSKRQRVERKIGNQALVLDDGFMPMQEAHSNYEGIREGLESQIIDQPMAIEAIIDALDRSDIRLPDDKRPIANLAFLGPTGVGKSETAKVLSQKLAELYDEKTEEDVIPNLIKIDCSNFAHGHEIAALTGAPPGYIGHDDETALNKENVEKPGTVVLFDEIEKGSPELFNLLLQVMEDGELKMNNTGEVTSFKDSVVIMSSNLGAKKMSDMLSENSIGFHNQEQEVASKDLDSVALKDFEDYFKPEFINRLNKEIVFHQLSPDGLYRILESKLDTINSRYESQLGARLTLTEGAKGYLVDSVSDDTKNGARPLIRKLEEDVQTIFGRHVGAGQIPEGTHVKVMHVSELPDDYVYEGDSELIFTSKEDSSIHKDPQESKEIKVNAAEADSFYKRRSGQRINPGLGGLPDIFSERLDDILAREQNFLDLYQDEERMKRDLSEVFGVSMDKITILSDGRYLVKDSDETIDEEDDFDDDSEKGDNEPKDDDEEEDENDDTEDDEDDDDKPHDS